MLKKTIYEDLASAGKKSTVILNFIAPALDKGDERLLPGRIEALLHLLTDVITSLDGGRGLDDLAFRKLREHIGSRKKNLDDFIFIHLPGLDHTVHHLGGATDQEVKAKQLEYLTASLDALPETELDKQIEELIKVLKDTKSFDNTVFILTADHGMYATKETEKEGEKTIGRNIPTIRGIADLLQKSPLDLNVLDEIATGTDGAPAEGDFDVVSVLNGAVGGIYVRDKRKDGDWTKFPSFEGRVVKASELLRKANSKTLDANDLPDPLLREKLNDLFSNSLVLILVKDAEKAQKFDAPYQVYEGLTQDGKPILKDLEQKLEEDKQSSTPILADFLDLKRHVELLNSKRAPDILLISRYSATDIGQRRYFSDLTFKAFHGHLTKEDGLIPLLINMPGGDTQEKKKLKEKIEATIQSIKDKNKPVEITDMSELIKKDFLEIIK